jgi:hypothetical protein
MLSKLFGLPTDIPAPGISRQGREFCGELTFLSLTGRTHKIIPGNSASWADGARIKVIFIGKFLGSPET